MQKAKKLILHRESVRRLEGDEAEQALGGRLTQVLHRPQLPLQLRHLPRHLHLLERRLP